MSDAYDATRRFRRRVAHGQAAARRRYLTPELREEADKLRTMVERLYIKASPAKRRTRVKRIREGATVYQSRRRNWRQIALFEDDK